MYTSNEKKRSVRINPLYNLIQDLYKEKHSLIQSQKVDIYKKEDRNAYFFRCSTPPTNQLTFAGDFKFDDNHLTVDHIYNDKAYSGLTCAHYTERYREPTTDRSIIIHVFYNSQGQYLYTEVKDKVGTLIQVSTELKKMVLELDS